MFRCDHTTQSHIFDGFVGVIRLVQLLTMVEPFHGVFFYLYTACLWYQCLKAVRVCKTTVNIFITLSYISELDYCKESMGKAALMFNNWSSFLNKAEAYIKGQLQSKPIDEPLLQEWYVMLLYKIINSLLKSLLRENFIVTAYNYIVQCLETKNSGIDSWISLFV